MAIDKRGNLQVTEDGYKKPSSFDLVYLEESPDYCVYNKKTGSLGMFYPEGLLCFEMAQ